MAAAIRPLCLIVQIVIRQYGYPLGFIIHSSSPPLFSPRSKRRSISATKPPSICALCIDNCFPGDPSSLTNTNSAGILGLLQELGLKRKQAELILQANADLDLASPASVMARIMALKYAGIQEQGIRRLISKSPDILTADQVDVFLRFVSENLNGILPARIERILCFSMSGGLETFMQKVELLVEHGIPRKGIVRILGVANLKNFCFREVEELKKTLEALDLYGITPEWLVRRPWILGLDLHSQLLPKAVFFVKLCGEDKAKELLGRFPSLLKYSIGHIKEQWRFWNTVGLSDAEIFKLATLYIDILCVSKAKKLVPRVTFLKECGFSPGDVFKFLFKSRNFMGLAVEANFLAKLCLLVKIGYRHRTREMARAVGSAAGTSCKNMQRLIGLLSRYGLTLQQIFDLAKKHPPVWHYKYSSVLEKIEYLTIDLGRDVQELVSFPAYLGYNLERRIKPRLEIWKAVNGKPVPLNRLLIVPNDVFAKTTKHSIKSSILKD